jgi:hypothetical protein
VVLDNVTRQGDEDGTAELHAGQWAPAAKRGWITGAIRPQPPFRLLLAAGIFGFYGVILILWLTGSPELHWVIENLWKVTGVKPAGHWYAPVPLPFFDLEGVLSWRDCYLRGFDVMTSNPCDPMGRHSNYSPLWYLLPTGGAGNTIVLGFLLDGAFLVSLPLLLAPQSWREFWIALLASISYSTLYAVERANVDILMFLMMLGSLWLLRKRYAGAALIAVLTAGVLKFYPLALLALLAGEPPRRFIRYAAIAFLAIAAFVLAFHDELARIPQLLPNQEYFSDQFGSLLFPIAVITNFGLPHAGEPILCLILIALACWAAWRLSDRVDPADSKISWTDPCFTLLLGGGMITCACFLLMVNIDYRAIFLLAVLRGLFALQRRRTVFARLAALGAWAALACLYTEPLHMASQVLENMLYGGDPGDLWHELPEVVVFLFREACWWFLVILLLALITTWIRRAPILASLSRRLA